METVDPLELDAWEWGGVERAEAELAGRAAVRLSGAGVLVRPHGVTLQDGVLEADLAVTAERSFHGVAWRVADESNYESFFVRPHQVGNPDAIQYTPVFNGLSAWQLYHGDGFWHPARFPVGEWFTVRVEFADDRLRAHVAGSVVLELHPATPRREAGWRWHPRRRRRSAARSAPLVGRAASCSRHCRPSRGRRGSFPAGRCRRRSPSATWPRSSTPSTTGRPLDAEPAGLADLARVNPVRDGADTVLARVVVHADRACHVPLELGFSDRAVVHLNGMPLYRGDDSYRSRDYRFLGSIGWFDTVYLPLQAGQNELVLAISESFGGWGVQARFPDAAGLRF